MVASGSWDFFPLLFFRMPRNTSPHRRETLQDTPHKIIRLESHKKILRKSYNKWINLTLSNLYLQNISPIRQSFLQVCITVAYRSKGSEAWQALVWSRGPLWWQSTWHPKPRYYSCCWVTWLTLFLSLTCLPSLNLGIIFSKTGILIITIRQLCRSQFKTSVQEPRCVC